MTSLLQMVFAAVLLGQGVQVPAPRGHVNDFAGVLSGESVRRMEQIAQDVRTRSGGEIAVVTLTDLQGREPSEVALQIGRQWGVGAVGGPGDAARNAGAVVLIVPRESAPDGRGRCWVATGRGAEGFLVDAEAGSICREATPLFQQRDYSRGTELVTFRVAQEFAREFGFTLDTALRAPVSPARPQSEDGGVPIGMIVLVIILIMFLSRGGRGGRRRRRGGFYPIFIPGPRRGGWGGGGGFGGGGFGGGGFGGGGFGGFGGGGGFSGGGGGSSW